MGKIIKSGIEYAGGGGGGGDVDKQYVDTQDAATLQSAKNYTDGKTPTVAQSTGQSTTDVMSQKAVTDAIAGIEVPTVVQTTGESTTDVMSQDAATKMIFRNLPGSYYRHIGIGRDAIMPESTSWDAIAIGNRAEASAQNSVSIGGKSTHKGSTALGMGSETSRENEISIGHSNTAIGGHKKYIANVRAGERLTDAANLSQGNRITSVPPNPTIEGVLGQLWTAAYANAVQTYQCTAIDTTDPNNPVYTWTPFPTLYSTTGQNTNGAMTQKAVTDAIAGVTPPTVVQSKGQSTTDVMSQKAVTDLIYDNNNIKIAGRSVSIGDGATVLKNGSVAIGANSFATRVGEVNVSTSDTMLGYDNSTERVIGGVHDGVMPTDAATVAQGNKLMTSAPTTTSEGVLGQLWTDTTAMHTYQCTAIDTTDPDNPVYTWTQRW